MRFSLACLLFIAGCGAYGTGLPNGDTPQTTYSVTLIAGGSAKSKRVYIQYFNVPGARSQRFVIGQFQTYHATIQSEQGIKISVYNQQQTDFVSCRIRTIPETKEIYDTDTHTARCYKKAP